MKSSRVTFKLKAIEQYCSVHNVVCKQKVDRTDAATLAIKHIFLFTRNKNHLRLDSLIPREFQMWNDCFSEFIARFMLVLSNFCLSVE